MRASTRSVWRDLVSFLKIEKVCWFIWVFFIFLLGVGEGFEYLGVVGCSGRVAQDGLALLLKQGSWVFLQGSRIEHRPPKSVVVGSNPTPPVLTKKELLSLSFSSMLVFKCSMLGKILSTPPLAFQYRHVWRSY